jgi:hypothetical protein
MAKRGAKVKYSAETIQSAVDIAAITGSTNTAAAIVGCPDSTAQNWIGMEKEGKLDELLSKAAESVGEQNADFSKVYRMQKRLEYLNAAMDVCLMLIKRMGELVKDTKSIKDIAVALGVTTEKLLLVGGEATARTDSVRSVDREELLQAALGAAETVAAGKVKAMPKRNTG